MTTSSPSDLRTEAPRPRNRSTSSSTDPMARRSKCCRFFAVLPSGTCRNQRLGPPHPAVLHPSAVPGAVLVDVRPQRRGPEGRQQQGVRTVERHRLDEGGHSTTVGLGGQPAPSDLGRRGMAGGPTPGVRRAASHPSVHLDGAARSRQGSGAAGGADRRRADDPGAVVEDDRLAGRDTAHPVVEDDAQRAVVADPWPTPAPPRRARAPGRRPRTDADGRRPAPAGVVAVDDVDAEQVRRADDDAVGRGVDLDDVARLAVEGRPRRARGRVAGRR